MFDSHAHIGKMTDNAIIASSRPDEWDTVKSYPHHAIGLLFPSADLADEFRKEVLSSDRALIGEVGPDRRFPSDYRNEFFQKCLDLSKLTGKHLVIHQVGMTGVFLDMLRSAYPLPPFIVHGFTGSAETAFEIKKLGGIISLGPQAERTKHFSKLIETEFLLETDMESGEMQTKALELWYKSVAECMNVSLSVLEEIIDERRAVFTS